MSLVPGARLGPYEIVAPLGVGGMGEVYRARDVRLHRDVANKVLPTSVAGDPVTLARFEREARSVAQLSHPNILGIFDVGRDGETVYAVMELLEGATLRERLAAGPLPPRKAIGYAAQIANGLAAAHDKGLTHRDLKPENLFVTRDERVKILDFGLAKPLDLGHSATAVQTVETTPGTIVGTIGYMAPEQVRGQQTDHRSDVFSFGAVLYEMVTGRRAFGGDTPADTISAILHGEPPELSTSEGIVPQTLDRIVRRCLEKVPERRFQSAHDLGFALESVSTSQTSSGEMRAVPGSAPRGYEGPLRVAAMIAAAAAATAVATWAFANRTRAIEPRWQQFTQVTDLEGEETAPSLSPDGTTVAYASRAKGSWDIYAQRVGGRNPILIAGDPTRQESAPAFSPDGRSVAYHEAGQNGGIFIVGATGESARRLTDFGFSPAWSPDGTRIAFTTEEIDNPSSRNSVSTLWVVDLAGGRPVKLGEFDAVQPAWSPSGARIAFWSNIGGQRDLYTVPAAGGRPVSVLQDAPLDWCPVWSPDGQYLYFASDRGGAMNLWRIAIDQSSGLARGTPEPVTTGVQAWSELPAFSRDGSRLAFRSRVYSENPVSISLDPLAGRALATAVMSSTNSRRDPNDVSPDGRWLSLTNGGEHQEDIFVSAIDLSGMRRLTDDAARDRSSRWARDGRSLAFYSNRDGRYAIWGIGIDGGGLRKIAGRSGADVMYPVFSPAGGQLVSSATSGDGVFASSTAPGTPAEGNLRKLAGTANSGRSLVATDWSDDARMLTGFMRDGSGAFAGVAVYDMAAARLTELNGDATRFVRWLPGNRIVYFTGDGEQLVIVDAVSKRRQVVDVRLPLRASAAGPFFAVARDGRTIYYAGARSEADIWVVERGAAASSATGHQ